MTKKWTKIEIKFLLEHRQNYSLSLMAHKLKRSETAILCKINRLGYTWRRKHCKLPHRYWSPKDKKFLALSYSRKIPVEAIAKKLNRTSDSVWSMIGITSLWRQTAEERSMPPEFSLTDTETAYIAGIIDGEGSFTINFSWKKRSPSVGLSLRITNTYLELIHWLKAKLNVRRKYRSDPPKSHWLPRYTVIVSQRAHLEQIIHLVLPYLQVREKEAIHFLEIAKLQDQGVTKLEILQKILKFKKSRPVADPRRKNVIKYLENHIKNLSKDT